ncbi:MAG: choice-of-anchor K domain-containing protein, partial [Cyanobacteriota bacterium]|nr:choice-of-anchor K domain-containing protein [Cyanobacteriota bacterium]
DGTGGNLIIDVGINPTSPFSDLMQSSVLSVINTWNALVPTTGNLTFGGNNNIPAGFFDFESVLLHEMGHALGLAHPNAASESGLSGDDRDYTKATKGSNGAFDLNPGADGIIGSADDIRGDDVNLNYFRIADNNPFATNLGIVDSTTYSRNINNLPAGDNFSANSDRSVGNALGFANTESVMQQGTFSGEAQRMLTADDVAGILYSMSGVDEIAGTVDDYTFALNFAGLTTDADIVIDFDPGETGFAVAKSRNGKFIAGTDDHLVYENVDIFFDPNDDWFFNQRTTLEGIAEAIFINPKLDSSPNATVSGIGTNSIDWGIPVNPPGFPSSLLIEEFDFAANLNEPFVLGEITFTNGTIEGDTGIDFVDLLLELTIDVPQLNISNRTIEELRKVDIVNTLNVAGDPNASADFVTIPPPRGLNLGFGNAFHVIEGETATASLIGRITETGLNDLPIIEIDGDEPDLDDLGDVPSLLNQPTNREFSFELLGFGQVLSGSGFITSTAVPEPSSIWGLFAFGAMGMGSLLKHKQNKDS